MAESKKRVIKSLEALGEDLKELIKKQYPNGYESNITRISNAKREPIFVFPLETSEATYLIKIPFTKNSEGEYDVESGRPQEFDEPEESENQEYKSTAEFGEEGYDDDGTRKSSPRDPSYDPDFDD